MKRYFRLPKLITNRDGGMMVIVGMAMTAIVGSAGVAIDIGRAHYVKAKLQNALDASGLAAGATLNSADLNTVTTKYLAINFAGSKLGATLQNVATNVSADKKTLTVTAQASVPTSFAKMFGKTSLPVNNSTEITRANSGMELVLVLDTTGSMNSPVNPSVSSTSKISALKSAIAGSGGLLDILYGTGVNTVEKLWVGVVPFSQAVNVGTSTGWASATSGLDWGVPTQAWEGCVNARSAPHDTSDTIPSSAMFSQYYAPTTGTITSPIFGSGVSGSCSGGFNAWKCTVLSSGKNRLTYDFGYNSSIQDNKGPNALCSKQVTPMVAEKSTVAAAVNNLTAAGSTMINLGMAWGQRMLSPNWRGLWGGQMNGNNLPLNYNTPLMNKVVVLMTDGINSFSNGNYTAYGFLSESQLGTNKSMNNGYSYSVSAEKVLDDRTLAICNTLKANGVIVYTIGFGKNDNNVFSDSSSVNGGLLRSCASSPDHYFLAPTNDKLATVFATIGDSLANLRISR